MKSIQVIIGGRSYPIKVTDEEEEMVLKVVMEINEKIKKFQMTYQQRDKQDCLSMALLTYAVEYYKVKENGVPADVISRLAALDTTLSEMI